MTTPTFIPATHWVQKPWNYDLANTVYLGSKSVAAAEGSPKGIFFKPDGSSFYLAGAGADDLIQYNMSTPWDITIAEFYVTTPFNNSYTQGMYISPDGINVFTSRVNNIFHHVLTVPWDFSIATYVRQAEFLPGGNIGDIWFKNDGTIVYCAQRITPYKVSQFTLSTPWDISTKSALVSSIDNIGPGVYISEGGKHRIDIDLNDYFRDYELTTAWDIGAETHIQNSIAVNLTGGIYINEEYNKMYSFSGSTMFGYDLNT